VRLANPFYLRYISLGKNSKIEIGKNVIIGKGTILKTLENGVLIIKNNCAFGPYTKVSAKDIVIREKTRITQNCIISGDVHIENNVVISPFCSLISNKHSVENKELSIDENDELHGLTH
jgi:carbonic anhydrase/acetyltransferase-like protein (isoleucine patch superfamily)